jgi:hypothetical protein
MILRTLLLVGLTFGVLGSSLQAQDSRATQQAVDANTARVDYQQQLRDDALEAYRQRQLLQDLCRGDVPCPEPMVSLDPEPKRTAKPRLSLKSGKYLTVRTVTIVDATPGAVIHYTIDGTTPGAASARYDGPLVISTTTILKVIAIAFTHRPSKITVAKYVLPAVRPGNLRR